ncbi:MAG TPA: hypothetical protein PKE64_18360 [Anaerolineae bacterium]|nr:hypothetical protein [Anaerolineae bacterium]
MTEQQLADLFSDQVDRLLQGQRAELPPEAADLAELLALVKPATKTEFRVNPATQMAFEQQITTWFGEAPGGSTMTILGLSKTWFISILVVVVLVSGTGFIGLITASLFFFRSVTVAPAPITSQPVITGTLTVPSSPTAPVQTGTPVIASVTPGPPATLPPGAPALIFEQVLVNVSNLCRGAYVTQSVLINRGPAIVTKATLRWQVIQGAQFVNRVNLSGPGLVVQDTTASLNSIALEQVLALDVQIEVNQSWWTQPDGTQIQVKLAVEQSVEPSQSQTLTVVKQGGQWVTLTGLAYQFGAQTLLVDGKTVLINECTALPPALPPDSGVQIIGILQPNGSFIAINITIVNIETIIKPPHNPPFSGGGGGGGGGDDDDDDGGDDDD